LKEIKECPFCKGTKFNNHSKATYWQVVELNFIECSNCGLIFSNPMPGMDKVTRGNRALTILHKSRGTISQYRGGKEYSFFLKRKLKSGVLLDIGCAEGIFLKGVEENSEWKAEGLEIGKSIVEFANNVLKVKVHHGTLDSLEGKENHYDHIRMNNVIEHVQDPVVFLNKTNEILKTGGTVYCTTPNGVQDGAILKVANRRGYKVNLLENHFYYYPPKTLRNIFKHCGFKIIRAFSEDVSHSLKDFGLLLASTQTETNNEYNLDVYDKKPDNDFSLSIDEINSYKNHPSAKTWKILFQKYRKEIFRFRFPYYLPLGHQQHIYAKKL
jgi:2-polyprenyl-3-methyl-5-hydroxy-6-metoxy-1,4-benzoquinol methylase